MNIMDNILSITASLLAILGVPSVYVLIKKIKKNFLEDELKGLSKINAKGSKKSLLIISMTIVFLVISISLIVIYIIGSGASAELSTNSPDLPSEKQSYKSYSQFPILPDFYEVIDEQHEILSRYYDTEKDGKPLTWHYLVESEDIATKCIEKYGNAIESVCSLLNEISNNQNKYYHSLDRSFMVAIWTNSTTDNHIYINISITDESKLIQKNYKYYDNWPTVPDFYDVIGAEKIVSRYYDKETANSFFTWHYLVDTMSIAEQCIYQYDQVLISNSYTKDEDFQTEKRQTYISSDRTIRLQIWTNNTFDEKVYINISINSF